MNSFGLTSTVPRDSLASSSIAVDMIRDALQMLPTGEWQRSLGERASEINGAVEAWKTTEPSVDLRQQVSVATLDLFGEIMAQ